MVVAVNRPGESAAKIFKALIAQASRQIQTILVTIVVATWFLHKENHYFDCTQCIRGWIVSYFKSEAIYVNVFLMHLFTGCFLTV